MICTVMTRVFLKVLTLLGVPVETSEVALSFCLTPLLLRSTLLLLRIQPSQYSVQFNDDGSSAGFLWFL